MRAMQAGPGPSRPAGRHNAFFFFARARRHNQPINQSINQSINITSDTYYYYYSMVWLFVCGVVRARAKKKNAFRCNRLELIGRAEAWVLSVS